MDHLISRAVGVCLLLIGFSAASAWAQATTPPPAGGAAAPSADANAPISQAELEQIVAPIALYPDSLMTQILMASTYPLEIVEADRFVKAHKDLQGDALTAELEKQNWDPSTKSLVQFPTVLEMLSTNLDSTVKLGDAFLADQKRVLDTVQQLRAKAQANGNLKTTEQQKVVVEQQGPAQVIVIESPDPQVIYVPTYNPTVVYGTWPYPAAPPYYYQPPNYAAAAVSGLIGFGVGVACGAAWGYAWGHCDWGHGDVNVNVNQNANFNRNINRSNYQNQINANNNRLGAGGSGTWQHDPSHRQGVAYRDNGAAQKYGGTSANQAVQARNNYRGQADAGRQDIARGGADQYKGNAGSAGGVNAQNRASSGGVGSSGGGMQNPSAGSGSRSGAFGDVSSGNDARSSSQRGSASRSGSGGGGGSYGGGGGGGGGSRGGGGGGGGGGGRR